MKYSSFIIKCPGGEQEEGTALRIPVAVLRNVTGRPKGVETGVLVAVQNHPIEVRRIPLNLLRDQGRRQAVRQRQVIYGIGSAWRSLAAVVTWNVSLSSRPEPWAGNRLTDVKGNAI